MTAQEKAKRLYTKANRQYQKLFIDVIHYEKGLEFFFKKHQLIFTDKQSILDAGTGTGTLIKALYRVLSSKEFKQKTFAAFDITPAMLNRFKIWIHTNNLTNISLKEADVLEENLLPNGTFDMIMSSAMLEYVDTRDFITAVKILKNKLKKNGTYLLIISKKSIMNFFLINRWWKANLYSKRELQNLLEKSGFIDIRFHPFPGRHFYLNWWGYIITAK